MISVRFNGPLEPMRQLRDSIKAMGARPSMRENNDGLTARVYVDFDVATSEDMLRRFGGQPPTPQNVRPLPPDQVVIDVNPTPARAPLLGPAVRFHITWRR